MKLKKVLGSLLATMMVVSVIPAKTHAASSLPEAVNNVITLTEDVTFDSSTTITIEGNVTLDLNGFSIIAKDTNASGNYQLFLVKQGSTFTIKDDSTNNTGKIELTATTDRSTASLSTIVYNDGGTVNVYGGNLEHKGGTYMAYVIDNDGGWIDNLESTTTATTTNIYEGYLKSSYRVIRLIMGNKYNGTVVGLPTFLNVYDGKLEGTKGAIWAQYPGGYTDATAEINISGGEIISPAGVNAILTSRADDSLSSIMTTISGTADIQGNILAENGELQITGGTVNGEFVIKNANDTVTSEENIIPFITGGTFSEYTAEELGAYLVDGTEIKTNEDGTVSAGDSIDDGEEDSSTTIPVFVVIIPDVEAVSESGEAVDIDTIRTDKEARDALGRKNVLDTIKIEDAEGELVDVTYVAGRKHKTETIYVLQYADGEFTLVDTAVVNEKGKVNFTVEGNAEYILSTVLPKVTGWVETEEGMKFYDYSTGEQRTGWVADGENWYFMDHETGVMMTNVWVARDASGAVWYYVGNDGAMVTDTTIDGYNIDANGEWHA